MRNSEKDAAEMAERRKSMLDVGFRMFSERRIEAVSMQEVATACGLGIATLYRYFSNKLVFVIAIGTQRWVDYLEVVEERYQAANGPAMNGAQEYEFFLDFFIDLYQNHKDLLRFNRNFDSFVQHEGATAEQMRPYNESVDAFARKFGVVYEKGLKDGTLRCDLSGEQLFVTSMYTMLTVAAKYAEGLIYPVDVHADMTEELTVLRDVLLSAYVV